MSATVAKSVSVLRGTQPKKKKQGKVVFARQQGGGKRGGYPSVSISKAQINQLAGKLNAKSALVNAGRFAGGLVGLPQFGAHLGAGISKAVGFGDYEVVENSLIKGSFTSNGKTSQQAPDFSTQKREIRVLETEFIGDVISSATPGAFTVASYTLNPTNPLLCPWLATLATSFNQYRWNGIILHFRSTSSEFNGSSQALGTVIAATDYDPTDPTYPNKANMENSQFAMSCKASESMMHGIECSLTDRPMNILYTDANSGSADKRFTSLGNFQIASQGCSVASVNLGELWISYDISLMKKEMPSVNTLSARINGVNATGTNIYGTTPTYPGNNTLQVTALNNTLTFQNTGQFLVDIYSTGASLNDIADPTFTNVNCTTQSVLPFNANTAQTAAHGGFLINVTAVPATCLMTHAGMGGVTASTTRVSDYLYALQ